VLLELESVPVLQVVSGLREEKHLGISNKKKKKK